LLLTIVFLLAFIHLGTYAIGDSDEAVHTANVYEMYKSGNWIVNTKNYITDYFNVKPPLYLWLAVLSMKLFGSSMFAARFPSALACCLLCGISAVFMWKKFGRNTCIFYLACFPLLSKLFAFHGFRSCSMDGLFTLLFAAALISLFLVMDHPRMLILYGLFIGLGFMTKSTHILPALLIGILFIPFIRKSIKPVYLVTSILSAVIVPAVWAFLRYQYDGFIFLKKCLVGSAEEKMSGRFTANYLKYILGSRSWKLMLITVLAALIVSVVCREKIKKETVLFFSMWIIVPVLLYSLSGTYLEWYIYPASAAVPMVTALCLNFILKTMVSHQEKYKKAFLTGTRVFAILFVFACVAFSCHKLYQACTFGGGGGTQNEFNGSVKSLSQKTDDVSRKCYGQRSYIETDSDGHFNEPKNWHDDYLAMAEVYLDIKAVDGGVEGFLADPDPDCILLLDSKIWDKYADVLTGHVMPENSGFIILTKDYY
jgi:4-amino-4-deoxy-L-arabinose transferase-like glycosyltransferase